MDQKLEHSTSPIIVFQVSQQTHLMSYYIPVKVRKIRKAKVKVIKH